MVYIWNLLKTNRRYNMKENRLAELSDEVLLKRRDLIKGIAIGSGVLLIILLAIFICLAVTKGLNDIPLASLIPVLLLPVSFSPILIVLGQLNKEMKGRNLK